MLTSRLFTQADHDRITAAVKEAESKTSGEIVPYVVEQSDMYEDACWRGALLFTFAALGVMVTVRKFTSVWLPEFTTLTFIVIIAAGVGFILVNLIPALTRLLAGKELIEAIQQCSLLLQKRGVERRPDDTDQLANTLRMGDKI